MPILGGWNTTVWYGGDPTPATCLGVITRPDPVLDPALINIRGTGKRGLRNIILGLKDFRLNIEWAPSDSAFIRQYQDGTEISKMHYKVGTNVGLTFTALKIERLTVSCRAGDILRASAEIVAKDVRTLDTNCPWGGTEIDDVLAWINFIIKVAPKATPTSPVINSKWHEWRYEVRNNLERLANVDTKTTRSLEQRHRDVTGMLVWDLENYSEWLEFVGSDAEKKFYLQIMHASNYLLGSANGVYTQWGRLDAPHGPEDLQLKRFPFTCLDLT